jgi:hypothetical protein
MRGNSELGSMAVCDHNLVGRGSKLSPTPDKFVAGRESSQHVAAWRAGDGVAQRLGYVPTALGAIESSGQITQRPVHVLEPRPTIPGDIPQKVTSVSTGTSPKYFRPSRSASSIKNRAASTLAPNS